MNLKNNKKEQTVQQERTNNTRRKSKRLMKSLIMNINHMIIINKQINKKEQTI